MAGRNDKVVGIKTKNCGASPLAEALFLKGVIN
jgi:hypothetical protein